MPQQMCICGMIHITISIHTVVSRWHTIKNIKKCIFKNAFKTKVKHYKIDPHGQVPFIQLGKPARKKMFSVVSWKRRQRAHSIFWQECYSTEQGQLQYTEDPAHSYCRGSFWGLCNLQEKLSCKPPWSTGYTALAHIPSAQKPPLVARILWNSLPVEVRQPPSLSNFRHWLKTSLFHWSLLLWFSPIIFSVFYL